MNLIKEEMKLLLKRKMTYIILLITLIAAIIFPLISFQGFSYIFIDEIGNAREESGINAIKKANNLQNESFGYLDENLISSSAESYYESYNLDNNEINWNEEFTKYIPLNESFIYFYEEYNNQGVNKDQAIKDLSNNFYSHRDDFQNQGFSELLDNDKGKINLAKKQESNVKKPFYYQASNGWDMYIMYFSYFIKIVMLASMIYMAFIYTRDKETNFYSIIFSTKLGKTQYSNAKLIVNLGYCMIVCILGIIIYSLIGRIFLDPLGRETSVQLIQLFSPKPLNIGNLFSIVKITAVLGVLAISLFTASLSKRLKTSKTVILIMLVIFSIYIVFNGLVDLSNDYLNFVVDLIPFRSSDMYTILLEGVNIYNILSINVFSEYIVILGLIILIFISSLYIIKNNNH